MADVNSASPEQLVSKNTYAVIAKLLEEQCIKNYTIDTSAGSIRGDNFLGIIGKVDVHGEDESGRKKTINLIVKSAPRTGFMRQIVPLQDIFEREIYAYTTIFPAFAKFQAETKIEHPFNSVAKFYTSLIDESNEVLIMENMKELGYRLWERRNPYDYNHALLAVKEYGKFHAVSYALRDQKPDLFEKLTENLEDSFVAQVMFNDSMEDTLKKFVLKFLACLDPAENKIAYEKFKDFLDNIPSIMKNVVSSVTAGKYAVIGHGDCWINNLLYKYENEEEPLRPTKMCLLDWQLIRLGSPVLDLSYLLFSSTNKNLREKYYNELIFEYYHSLSTHVIALGSNPAELLPFEVLEEHLKKFSAYGLYMSINSLMAMTSEVGEIPDVHSDMTIEDMENFMPSDTKSYEKYKVRLNGVILDFIEYGYL